MKKALISVCLCGLLMLSAVAAFAADGGHAGHVTGVTPDIQYYNPMSLTSADVVLSGDAEVTSVASVSLDSLKTLINGAKFYVTDASKTPVLYGGLTLDIKHKGAETIDLTFNNTTFAANLITKAWIQDKNDPKVFSAYTAVQTGTTVVVKDVPLDNHFSVAAILFGSENTQPGDSGGSSGCNAGAATAMLLLSALPLLYFRKK